MCSGCVMVCYSCTLFSVKLLVNVSSVGSFLDTSECPPRRSFFTNEARQTFSEVKIPLNSVKDVLKYWFGLREVCLSTRILSGGCGCVEV